MEVPNYKVTLGLDQRWYIDGPGEGMSYTSARYTGHRCTHKHDAESALPIAIKAYKFGYKQFQLQMQQALGLPVDSGQIVDHVMFVFKPQQFAEPTDRNYMWYVSSSCDIVRYESIMFTNREVCKMACAIALSTYKAGFGDARTGICKLINAKSYGS